MAAGILTLEFLTILSTTITVIMGVFGFFIVFNAYKRSEGKLMKEFSKRMLLLVTYLTLTVIYWGIYQTALQDYQGAVYPLHFAFMFLFVFVVWGLLSFERLMKKYDLSQDDKLEMLQNNEINN